MEAKGLDIVYPLPQAGQLKSGLCCSVFGVTTFSLLQALVTAVIVTATAIACKTDFDTFINFYIFFDTLITFLGFIKG
jgi:hypothetical protein